MGTEPDQTHHVMPLCHHSATTESAWSGREAEFTNYLYVNGKWLPAALAIAIFELNYHTPWLCCSVVYCSYCRPHAQWPMVVVAGWGCTMCDCDCIHDMICPNVSWFGQFLLLGCAIFVPNIVSYTRCIVVCMAVVMTLLPHNTYTRQPQSPEFSFEYV